MSVSEAAGNTPAGKNVEETHRRRRRRSNQLKHKAKKRLKKSAWIALVILSAAVLVALLAVYAGSVQGLPAE